MEKERLINFIQGNLPNMVVNRQSLVSIVENFEEISLRKNDFYLKEGKTSGYLFLAKGFMRAFTFDTEGNEVTTYFYPPNRMVFEVSSFFQGTASSENIQAITDCEGYHTSFEKLNMLFHTFPEFREFGRLMLVKEFVAYKQRTLALINRSAEDRYAELVAGNIELFQYAQLRHIASFLGITDTSLSRIRRDFSKKKE